MSTPGSYTVTYDVMDVAGNSAAQRTRTIIVSAAPSVITNDEIPPFSVVPTRIRQNEAISIVGIPPEVKELILYSISGELIYLFEEKDFSYYTGGDGYKYAENFILQSTLGTPLNAGIYLIKANDKELYFVITMDDE